MSPGPIGLWDDFHQKIGFIIYQQIDNFLCRKKLYQNKPEISQVVDFLIRLAKKGKAYKTVNLA